MLEVRCNLLGSSILSVESFAVKSGMMCPAHILVDAAVHMLNETICKELSVVPSKSEGMLTTPIVFIVLFAFILVADLGFEINETTCALLSLYRVRFSLLS